MTTAYDYWVTAGSLKPVTLHLRVAVNGDVDVVAVKQVEQITQIEVGAGLRFFDHTFESYSDTLFEKYKDPVVCRKLSIYEQVNALRSLAAKLINGLPALRVVKGAEAVARAMSTGWSTRVLVDRELPTETPGDRILVTMTFAAWCVRYFPPAALPAPKVAMTCDERSQAVWERWERGLKPKESSTVFDDSEGDAYDRLAEVL